MLTGDPIPAARAAEFGLVNHVVALADLLPTAIALAEKITGSCDTNPMRPRTSAGSASRRSTPSRRMAPRSGSQKRSSKFATVVLPAPDGPTNAIVAPAGISNDSPDSADAERPG